MALNNVMFGLLVILVIFIVVALISEYFDFDPLCFRRFHDESNQFLDTYMMAKKQNQEPLQPPKYRIKKLINSSAEGMVRGIVTGSLTGGLGGAVSYGIALGVVNPFMVIFLESLPPGALFRH
jgi:hypothetical protein